MGKKVKVLIYIFFICSFILLNSCREPSPLNKKMIAIKDEISALQEKNEALNELYEKASRSKRSMIEKKIHSNKKRINKLNKILSKLSKGTQKRVLRSISNEAKRRSNGN